MTEITNTEDLIDAREVIERIAELETLRDEGNDYGDDEAEELASLSALATQWKYGETLIRDSYFVEYAQQLAEDIGAIDSEASWPARCIDWEQAAGELQMDYTAVDFGGVTYWVR